MITIPKPPKRGKKPRKPIKRAQFKRRPKSAGRKMAAYADSLWSTIVRRKSPTCVAPRLADWRERGEYVPCGKPTEAAAHGYGRSEWGTRYVLSNGFPSCHGCNNFVYGPHSRRDRLRLWYLWCERQWGPEWTESMRRMARRSRKELDMQSIVTALEAALHGAA